jgi:hypothetical protein
VKIEVSQASSKARKKLEELGGSVKTIFYNRVALRYLLKVCQHYCLFLLVSFLISEIRLFFQPEKFVGRAPPKRMTLRWPSDQKRFDDYGPIKAIDSNNATTSTTTTSPSSSSQ